MHTLLISVIIIGSFLISNQIETKVLISKIQVSGVSTTDEYIELYNFSSSTEALAGWKLIKLTSGGSASNVVSSFPNDVVLDPFGYFLIAHRDYAGSVSPDLTYSNSSVSLAANNVAELFDAEGASVDKVDWSDIEPEANLVRLPNDDSGNYLDTDSSTDFVTSTSLPNNSHSPSRPFFEPTSSSTPISDAVTDWTKVVINEVVPNPASGNEWVELYNLGSSTIDIAGGTLCDGRSENCTIAALEGQMPAFAYFVIEISGSKLNNDGDRVVLLSPSGNTIDTLNYEDLVPQKGQAIARSPDNIWLITETLTPGSANIVTVPPAKESLMTIGGGASGLFTSILETGKTSDKQNIKSEKEPTILWSLRVPSVVIQNSSTLFDAHLSADPRGGELFVTWQFGNDEIVEGARVLRTFATSGIYSVTVRATSTQGTVGMKRFELKVDGGTDPVVLSEVMVKPNLGEDEWVSLQSLATTSVDLGGWKIGNGVEKWFTIPNKTIIGSGKTLRFYKTATHLSLVDSGGSVLLSNKDGRVVDILEYGKAKRNEVVPADESVQIALTKSTSTKKVLGIKTYAGLSVADTKELKTNSGVRVAGVVESLPGKPYANYFYIRDNSGGIQIYSYKKDFPKLALGDLVTVSGQIGSSAGEARVRTSAGAITKVSTGAGVVGELKTVDEISSEDSGTLVSVEGEITRIKSSLFYLDDGAAELVVALPQKANIERAALKEGLSVQVTGIVVQNNSGTRLVPRSNDDIKIIKVTASNQQKPRPFPKGAIFGSGGIALIGIAAAIKKFLLK